MLPQTKVTFTTENPKLQRLYDTAVRKALNNLNTFAGDQVLVEGGGYEKIWLETQPMGGEMYAKHNITAAQVSRDHNILYRTVIRWKTGERQCPHYVVSLLDFYYTNKSTR